MGKHEARTSLLSGSSLDPTFPNDFYITEPVMYHERSSSRQKSPTSTSYSRSAGYSGYSRDDMSPERFAEVFPAPSYSATPGFAGAEYTTAGGYHQREGFAVGSPGTSKANSLKYYPTSTWQWAFLSVVLAQAICGLTLECYIFARFQMSISEITDLGPHGRMVPTYLSLFIFGFLYQLVLVYDALRMKNTIQTIGLCLYNVGLLVEAAVQSDQIHDAVVFLQIQNRGIDPFFWNHIQPYIIAVPCVIGLGLALMTIITWKLYHEFAWSIYKDISADLQLKRRFLSYQIYIALLKFDFFFFLAFTVQFLVVVIDTTDVEFYLTIAAIPLTIVLLFLAAWWTRRESVIGMVCIIVVYFGALAYFIFKLVRMYWAPRDRLEDYLPARRSLTTFAIITVLLLLVTIGYAIICTKNFNKGLKQHIAGPERRRRAASMEMDKMYGHGEAQMTAVIPNRMTID